MGKLHLDISTLLKTTAILMAVMFGLFSTQSAYAESCTLQGGTLFPSQTNWISQFSDARRQNVRRHTGIDMGFNLNHTIPQPPGCEILLNSKGGYRFNNKNEPIDDSNKKIIGSDKGGYGVQLFYKCGEPDGEQITLRYAHVPKNPITNSGEILQGCSGSSGCGARSHYHFEIVIGNRPVDPECVMYGEKPALGKENFCNPEGKDCAPAECRKCPDSLPAGAQDLCNADVRKTLIQHGQTCTATGKYPDGQTRVVPGGRSIDPSRLGETNGTPDAGSDVTPSGGDDNDDGTDDDATTGGGFTGNPDDIYPPDPPDPPITPPAPDTPGKPGGPPNLTPPPAPGKEPEELSGCATDTWAAMVNQAVMETRREDILNKRFIVKPDTVLDYSCFDLYVKKTADEAGPIFSETKKWANLPVDLIGKTVTVKRELGSKSLDGALMDIVQSVAINYRRGQFNNPHLAGSTPVSASAGATSCDVMAKVWKASKCKNFDDVAVFYTFDDLKTKEPREYPANMKCN